MYHHILSYLLVPVARIELAMHRLKVCCHTTWLHEHMVDNGGFEPQSVPVFKNVPFGCGFRSTTLTQYRSLATADHSDAPLMHQSLPMKKARRKSCGYYSASCYGSGAIFLPFYSRYPAELIRVSLL